MRLILFLMFCSYSLSSIAQDKIDTISINIEPYKTLSYGAFFKSLTLKSPDCGVEYIGDFDFEWGYKYKLVIKRIKLAQPMEDAGDTDYELIEVVSKEQVVNDYKFNVSLSGNVYLGYGENDSAFVFTSDSSCTYLGEMSFTFSKELGVVLHEINGKDVMKKGEFTYQNNRITLIGIKNR